MMCVPMTFFLQPGFGFPHPLVTGMRPGAAPFPNFFIPMAQQGQQAQRPGGRRAGAGPLQLTQQHPMQMIQQQVCDKTFCTECRFRFLITITLPVHIVTN